jgi:hypothetical protein
LIALWQVIKVWITTFPKNKPRKIIIRNSLSVEEKFSLALGQSGSGSHSRQHSGSNRNPLQSASMRRRAISEYNDQLSSNLTKNTVRMGSQPIPASRDRF